MTTQIVDLSRINALAEIIVRAGNTQDPNARRALKQAYSRPDQKYPDTIGVSTLFRPGATLDDLAREGSYPHPKLGFSVVGKIAAELIVEGYELVLYVTPYPELHLPDHHSLAVAMGGVIEQQLSDAAADALIRALTVVDNPYRMTP